MGVLILSFQILYKKKIYVQFQRIWLHMVQLTITGKIEWLYFQSLLIIRYGEGWQIVVSTTITIEEVQVPKSEDKWDKEDPHNAKVMKSLVLSSNALVST